MKHDYKQFLMSKAIKASARGMKNVPDLADHLFPFQHHCVDFALRAGCAGLFLDTGLGKTECQLEWCQKAIEETNGKALILTPLAVAGQTNRRAKRWGYEARIIREQTEAGDWKQFHSIKNLLIALSIESAELLELVQWKSDAEISIAAHRERKFRSDFQKEIADIFIYLLLVCEAADIDFMDAIYAKIEENGTKYPIEKSRGNATKYSEFST